MYNIGYIGLLRRQKCTGLGMLILTTFMQVYIVSGGDAPVSLPSGSRLSSTETLEKGKYSWKVVDSLPSGRERLQGLGLDHGRFIVTGQFYKTCNISRT